MRDGRATKVGFVVVGLPLWINLDSVAPLEYKSRVLWFIRGIVELEDMSLLDCA